MNLQELKSQKQTGDNANILRIVNARRGEINEPPYALSTVRAMMNGTRTMRDDVLKAAIDYYDNLSKLQTQTV